MKQTLLAIFAALFFSGCMSIPVPTPENDTLVAGQFFVNWDVTGNMSEGNGRVKTGIRFYFQNHETRKTMSVTTKSRGWFLTNKMPAGDYTLSKITVERVMGNSTYTMILIGAFDFAVEHGVVNNIGAVQIDIGDTGEFIDVDNNGVHDGIRGGAYTCRVVDYDTVQFDFQEQFVDSEWIDYEWKNNSLFEQ
jgi:hypothetical protein